MRTLYKGILVIVVAIFAFSFKGINSPNSDKITPILNRALNIVPDSEVFVVWVDFTDKGSSANLLLSNPRLLLTEEAIERRMKVKEPGNIVDFSDIPVNNEYVNKVQSYGLKVRNVSKWFNSVSCYATKAQIEALINEPFVKKVDIVARFKSTEKDKPLLIEEVEKQTQLFESDNTSILNYGASYHQSQLINVPIAHDSGYTGKGVLIAVFDSGFDNLGHPCYDSIRARGIRTKDFVNGDTSVANDPGQMGDGGHGSRCLSLIVGYAPGNLISPAFDSRVILAKTENTESETPLEEDNWIAAAEWADSLGADIISASLTYREMDPGSPYSYDYTWMNGDSCRITIAADLVVGKGVIVVNSAGNNGFDNVNTLGAPADGDSVFAIGSVDDNAQRSSFSSVGPTIDGRHKPDFMAMGRGNVTAQSGPGNNGYSSFGSGTSFSCPMAAGVIAMLLQANPTLTPMQVRDILRQTSSNSFTPNSLVGWGLINAWDAIVIARTTSIDPISGNIPNDYTLGQNVPNPFNPATVIPIELKKGGNVTIKVFDMAGRESATINRFFNAGTAEIQFNASQYGLSSGVYFYAMIVDGNFVQARKMMLVK
jgi:serine protease AprX